MLGNIARSADVKAKLQALEALGANVMLADRNLNITYMNPALVQLMRRSEADIQRELHHFSVDKLIGSNIDVFHKNPTHQRKMLASLKKLHNATIWVGNHPFDLRVMPLLRGGKCYGFVVEWMNAKERLLNVDYAAQIAAISRVQGIIEFSPSGQVITANEIFLKVLGYHLDELEGSTTEF